MLRSLQDTLRDYPVTTVRLDSSTRAILERLSEDRGQTRSEVIRDAIARLGDETVETSGSALDLLAPFIGIADSGGRDLSRETGKKLREILEAKRDARRSG